MGTFAAAQILRFVPRVRVRRAVGRLCDARLPPGLSSVVTQAYARAYRVNLDEVAPQPDGAYPSFDSFFTRRLREGARPIDEAVVVSPADGMLLATGTVTPGAQIQVKRQLYEVSELIGDRHEAARYVAGAFGVVYLSPRDYHRVHAPVDGELGFVNSMAGDLYPVNAIGERHIPRLFVRNHRVAIALDTKSIGRVYVVMVGATIVGRITVAGVNGESTPPGLHRVVPSLALSRGDEIGIFHLGSTVVVLLEAGVVIAREIGPVACGQALVRS